MPQEKAKAAEKMRLAKYIAHAGVCSRRDAEKLIEEGVVKVNGEVITSPATNVSDEDEIIVRRKKIEINKKNPRLFVLNKPQGVICTTKDPHGRQTVFDLMPEGLPRLVSVGRLDLNSEGLIMFTDSPELADNLMKSDLPRTYRVRISGNMRKDQVEKLERGMTVEGISYAPAKIEIEPAEKKSRNSWIKITLTEGKNREIRKLMEGLGLQVSRLVRLSYGHINIDRLPKRAVVEAPFTEIQRLMKDMGK